MQKLLDQPLSVFAAVALTAAALAFGVVDLVAPRQEAGPRVVAQKPAAASVASVSTLSVPRLP